MDSTLIMEDLILRTKNFSCADNRLDLSELPDPAEDNELNLIGKIISSRNFSSGVVKDITILAWNPSKDIKISRLDKNIFLFTFGVKADLEMAFSRRPWTFKGAHLMLKSWVPDLHWLEVNFSTSIFWVQIHGLPRIWQKREYIARIGREIGSIQSIEDAAMNQIYWKKFIRLRIDIDINKPLVPGVFLPRRNNDDLWIGFKFEKLPEVCFSCGKIGHLMRECSLATTTLSNQFSVRFTVFGDWLSAVNEASPPGVYERISLTIVPTSCTTSLTVGVNPSATLFESSEQRKFGQLSVAGSSTCMEGSGLVAHTDPVQSGPAVNDMRDKVSGSEILGIVGSQSSSGSGRIPQGEALMDAGVVLGQATHEVRKSQNSCLVPGHIPIRMSREELLSVSPHSMCMRPNYSNCMIWDGIVYNFGPDSEEDADPSDFFPLNLLSPPNPNNNIESALFEVPINIGPIESAQSSPSHPANTQKNQLPSSVSIPNISTDSSLKKSSRSPNLKRKPISSKLTPNKKKSKTILASQNLVSYPTSSPSTSHSDEHGPVLEGNPISLEISSQISINPHQDSHLFSMAEEAGLTMPHQVP
jgi:hypothetical protein